MAVDRNKLIASAQKYIQKGQFRKAIKDYEALVAAYPDDIRVLLKIGDLQAREGLTADAMKTYNEVADYYVAHGFFLKAVAVYKQLLRVKPDDAPAQMRLADLYAQLSLFSDALSQFQTVATQLQQEGKFAQYLKVLQRMVEIDPGRVGNRIKLAEQLLKIEDVRAAAVHFGAACDSLLGEGRFEEYIKVAERFVHQVPDDSERTKQLARVYLEVGRPANAATTLQPLFRSERYDTEALRMLIESMVQLGQAERAATALRDLIPVFEQHDRHSEKELALELLFDIDPNDPLARRHKSHIDSEELQFEILDGESVVELTPEQHATVARLLSETDVYLKYSLFEKSLGHLDQIFQIDPSSVEALKRRSRIYVDTHRPVDATRDMARLVRICCREQSLRPECEGWLREAARLAPDLPELKAARLEFDRFAGEVPELDAEDLLVPDHFDTSSLPVDDNDTLDEFDALFVDLGPANDSAGASALDQDEAFIREIESVFGENPNAASTAEHASPVEKVAALPAALDASLDRAHQLAEEGQLSEAHALLLELMGMYPEQAEAILRRLDELPSSEEVAAAQAAAGFDESPSSVVLPTLEALGFAQHALSAAAVDSRPSDDGDDDLFMVDDDGNDPLDDRQAGRDEVPAVNDVPIDLDEELITDAELFEGEDVPEVRPAVDVGYGILPVDAPVSFELPASRSPGVPDEDVPDRPELNALDEPEFIDDESDLDDAFSDGEFEELVLDDPDALTDAGAALPTASASAPTVHAPVGRPSPGMTLVFGPTAGALDALHDEEFKAAMELVRQGQVHDALEALQEQLFGDFPVAASFELSALRVQMGDYLDALRALEALQNAPDLSELDRCLIEYHRSLCLEALGELQAARDIWTSLQRLAPGLFPD
ncbi:MAG: tetratricopeptide repeat protein, partial [Myxococcales bacterium]|nr:tetratricopeptide repeat protein [Myxococcales bacterium]